MLITAYFTDKGIPKTGLFPIIDIWKSDKTLVVNAQIMTERAGAFYDYDFTAYDDTENYSFRADSIILTGYDRYKYNTNETEYNIKLFDIQTDLDNPNQYKADVSGLASAQEYDATLSGIQADLDDPDQYKADVSGLAMVGEYDIELATIQDDVTFLKDIEGGHWKIDKANKKMLFYKADNITLVATFNLFDENGNPAFEDIFERRRI